VPIRSKLATIRARIPSQPASQSRTCSRRSVNSSSFSTVSSLSPAGPINPPPAPLCAFHASGPPALARLSSRPGRPRAVIRETSESSEFCPLPVDRASAFVRRRVRAHTHRISTTNPYLATKPTTTYRGDGMGAGKGSQAARAKMDPAQPSLSPRPRRVNGERDITAPQPRSATAHHHHLSPHRLPRRYLDDQERGRASIHADSIRCEGLVGPEGGGVCGRRPGRAGGRARPARRALT
jgi:hypothetical protein